MVSLAAEPRLRVVVYGLVANLALAAVKLVAGLLGNSYALIADAVESLVDTLGSMVIFGGINLSRRRPDHEFPYGLGKAEALAAFVVGIIVLLAALGIAIEAVLEIRTPQHGPAPFTLVVLVGVIAIKAGLHYVAQRMATAEGSIALAADAFHHRADAMTSLAALAGISIAVWGGGRWAAADDWAALVASTIIFANGVTILKHSAIHLLDGAAPQSIALAIRRSAESVPGVIRIEKLIARNAGSQLFVDIHVHASPDLPLRDAHRLGGMVKSTIVAEVPKVAGVLVHMEPEEPAQPGLL